MVLCTGDIGGNEEMVETFPPVSLRSDGIFYMSDGCNDALGHQMALWCGADFQHGPAVPMTHAVAGPGQVLSCQDIGWLMVNRDGRRFVDENTPAAIEAGVEEGVMWKADTLEDLAAQLGIKDTDTFLATVERYNTLCAEGHDRDFGKDDKWMKSSIVTPPFYATKVTAITMTIQFGLNCNDQLQVCDADDNPIEGLYAAGNTCGNFFACDYPLLTPGVSHGRAITFGRVLGEALAKGEKITFEEA